MENIDYNRAIAEFMELKTSVVKEPCRHPVTRQIITWREHVEVPCYLLPEESLIVDNLYTDVPGYTWQYEADERFLVFYPEDLKYNSSWNWLMPVVEKCYEDAPLGNEGRRVIEESLMGIIDIEITFEAVIKYIEIYNKL
jgi:hypothetical protein